MKPLPSPRPPAPRATMRDVAALAGVSLKTVSRVLNREAGVSPAMSARVQQAADELAFQLNLGARSLRRSDGRTATIGLILENVDNPFSSALHRAVENVAREQGVSVLAGSLDEDPERERELVAEFSSRRVDGLIIMPTGTDHAYLMPERRAGTPMVFVDRAPGHPRRRRGAGRPPVRRPQRGRSPDRGRAPPHRVPRRPGPHPYRTAAACRLPRGDDARPGCRSRRGRRCTTCRRSRPPTPRPPRCSTATGHRPRCSPRRTS